MHELVGLHGHPVFLRRDALARGYDDKSLRTAQRDQRIVRVRHGAYTSAQVWGDADELSQHKLRALAVLETHGEGVALSHTSSVVMHGLPVWDADLTRVHVTRLDGGTTRKCHDIRYHRGALSEAELAVVAGRHRTTRIERAVVEHATVVSIESGLTTVDAYLNGHPAEPVQRARDQFSGWPGMRHVRITLSLARKGAGSVGESRLRYLCWEYHLPEPELQVPVYDEAGRLVGISDFAWKEHQLFGEFDGKVKFSKYLKSGETPSDAVFREKRREDRIREASGFSIIRFTWADLFDRDRTASRLRKALGLP